MRWLVVIIKGGERKSLSFLGSDLTTFGLTPDVSDPGLLIFLKFSSDDNSNSTAVRQIFNGKRSIWTVHTLMECIY